jgi:hypothetical protein
MKVSESSPNLRVLNFMLRSFILLSLSVALFSTFLSNEIHAQDFAPGRVISIRPCIIYPFGLVNLDSLIGRQYLLKSPGLNIQKFGNSNLTKIPLHRESRLDSIKRSLQKSYPDTDSLPGIYQTQPDLDSLLDPWLGKRFRIIDAEALAGLLASHQYYILAKFSESFKAVLLVTSSDLQKGGYQLISADILDNARARWVGKYLWMNVQSDIPELPPFSRVRVIGIDPSSSWRGPYAFHVVTDNNDTVTMHCKLQPPDTSLFSLDLGTPFGNVFLEGQPGQWWKCVPDSGFDRNGIMINEDSGTFFRTMKSLGVRTQSYDVTYSMTGQDSLAFVKLSGRGVWGMLLDSCIASFNDSKLCGIDFMIPDSASESAIRSELVQRFGGPSVSDTETGAGSKINTIKERWLYYSARAQLHQIVLSNYIGLSHTLEGMPKVFDSNEALFGMRATLFYGDRDNSIFINR